MTLPARVPLTATNAEKFSTMRAEVGPVDLVDLEHVAFNLRAADLDEIEATHGVRPDKQMAVMLLRACAASAGEWGRIAYAATGEPIALFGCSTISILDGSGSPWLLGTDRLKHCGRDLVRLGRSHVALWSQRWERLENRVDARHVESVRWLRRIGFTIHDPAPFGPLGLPFHRFEIGARA